MQRFAGLREVRAGLKRGLRELRRQYQRALRREHAAQGVVFAEWLRDNYYLLERETQAALRDLRLCDHPQALLRALEICRALTPKQNLTHALQQEQCSAAQIAQVPHAMRVAHLLTAMHADGDAEVFSAAIAALRALPDFDFDALLEQTSPLEAMLRRDAVYPAMDEPSRAGYRHVITRLAKREGVTEEEYAEQVLQAANGQHVGVPLLQRGARRPVRGRVLLWTESLLPVFLAAMFALVFWSWYLFPLLMLPLWALCKIALEAIVLRGVDTLPLPRLHLDEVPAKGRTLITVSMLLPAAAQAKKLAQRMEELHHSNGCQHVQVCVLADLPSAAEATMPQDDEDIAAAQAQVERLNRQYGGGFVLAVREREYSPTMGCYSGRERKRGAIADLVALLRGEGDAAEKFCCLAGDVTHLHSVNYLLALDADTQLPLDTAKDMLAAALHPANRPVFDVRHGRVVRGFGILAPHVEHDLHGTRRTAFAHTMAGEGGTSPYANRVSERYQDLFGCGIFAGKGLIDVHAFAAVERANPFPAEQVLSHDILEGGYLRCGFLADVHVADGFPARQGSYFTRQERWVRGDWQNILFLRPKRGLPSLARYQLFDNLRRSMLAPACLLALLVSMFVPRPASIVLGVAAVLGLCGGYLFGALRSLLHGGFAMLARDYYSGGLPAALGDVTRAVLHFVTLAQAAWTNTGAAVRGLWRSFVSRKKRLQWVTAAQSDATADWVRVLLPLWPSVLAAALMLIFGRPWHRLAGIILLGNVLFALLSGRERREKSPKLDPADTARVREYCADMWQYFVQHCTAQHNHLPPDNVQESPIFRVAGRTSPTNIGLYLLCVLSARDLDLIDTAELQTRLHNTLNSIGQLEKWNGHLLNWYDTRTMQPLCPRYVSTVDSGNLLVSLRVLRAGLGDYLPECPQLAEIQARLQQLEQNCDLMPLYNARRKLFHIGIDLTEGRVSPSYYDLLMSEARMTSYYAIAARKVPKKHWGALGRTLARQGRFTGPVSWTGTMFEYFMPYLFLPAPRGTLGYEALRFCLHAQRKRVAGHGNALPWGNSESGFYAFDAQLNYQYKAHGTQKLGLRRGLNTDLVLSPYSSFLAMQLAPKAAMRNLRRFERMHMRGSCGFYEAADLTPVRTRGQDYAVVRSYMAHHVGMSMLAALNALQDGILRKRLFADHEMASAQSLLHERMADRAVVFRDVEQRTNLRPREKPNTAKQAYHAFDPANPRAHLLGNGEWSTVLTDCGACTSLYRGVSIFKHSRDVLRRPAGVFAMLREENRKPVSITPAPSYNAAKPRVEFSAREVVYHGEGAQVAATMRCRVHPRLPAEERRIVLKNNSRTKQSGTLWLYLEPSLANLREEAEHPAFSKIFLVSKYDRNARAAFFTRSKQESGESLCLAVACTSDDAVCELSREVALRRGVPFGETTLSDGHTSTPDCCAAFEVAYELAAGEARELSLLLCAGVNEAEAARRLSQLRDECETQPRRVGAPCPFRAGELAGVLAQRVLPKLLYYTPISPAQLEARAKATQPPQTLWSVGVSGDMPHLYFEVDSPDDLPAVQPYFSLFCRLRAAGVPCELALGYREGGDYRTPMVEAITDALKREGCVHWLHQRGGVHLVNLQRATPEAIDALKIYAADLGEDNPLAQEYCPPTLIAHTSRDGRPERPWQFVDGGFHINHTPPVPWSLPLCNPAFGTLVSDSSLGFTWAVNSRENKLTPWDNDPRGDNQGELLLLKFGSRVYDMLQGTRVEFTPQHAKWHGQVQGLRYTVTVTVPPKGATKRVHVALHNHTPRQLTPEICYYTEPVLGTRRQQNAPLLGERLPDGWLLHSPAGMIRGHTALLLQGGADFCCADRAAFWRGHWRGNSQLPQGDPCAAVGRQLHISPNEDSTVAFSLAWAATKNAALCMNLVAADSTTRAHQTLRITTPDPALNHMVNTWLPHQIMTSRLWGRTGHSQCGGAFGMRDQLQDVSALTLTRPELVRRQIIRAAAAQFPEGDAMHWWHRLPGHVTRGVRSRYADDYLWLPFVTADYVQQTGDYQFLHTMISFRQGELLQPHEKERYAAYPLGDERASLYEHCTRALDRALTLMGEHGLPLMMGGDWNDGMNAIGARGRGESVWLGMFMSMVCDGMAPLCEHMHEHQRAAYFREQAQRLRSTIDEKAWTGDRYLRAFWDDGVPLGGGSGNPCSVDLLPQSFATLCGMPNAQRRNFALNTAAAQLINPHGIQLLREPFSHKSRRAGYINDYPPGLRENGGQYTHAAMWFIIALLREGRTDEAYAALRLIVPADFCHHPQRAARYRGEPFCLAGDVNYSPGCEGRAGWTWYTGSAAWMLRCVTEELLGLRMHGGEITQTPRLPKHWQAQDVNVELGTSSARGC